MIAMAGYLKLKNGEQSNLDLYVFPHFDDFFQGIVHPDAYQGIIQDEICLNQSSNHKNIKFEAIL